MRHLLCLVVFCSLSLPAIAATAIPPSAEAGRVPERFQEPVEPKSLPRTEMIKLPAVEAPKESKSIKLTVARFEVIGSTVYSPERFTSFTAPLTGKEITLSEIYALAGSITGVYGNDGYSLTRAIVPPQDLQPKDAVVRIEIVEGYVDEVKWPEGLKEKYRDLFSQYAISIKAEKPVNIKTIERYMLLASDLPGLRLKSTFEASPTNQQASTLIVDYADADNKHKLVDAEATIDNRGSEGRGPWQGQTAFTLNNAFGFHEAVSLRYASAIPTPDQMQYVEGSYKQVLNAEGLTFSFSGSYNKGLPGLSDLRAIDYDSEGTNFNAGLSYLLVRSRDQNLSVSGNMFFEDSQSTALDSPFTEDRLRGFRASGSYDNADSLGAINAVQLTFSQGISGLGSTKNDNPIASRSAGYVNFTKAELNASRTQPLAFVVPNLSAYIAAYGQYAFAPLLSAEQCGYGGKAFGRAFDPSSLTGDNCINSALELRYDLQIPNNPLSKTQLYGFVDEGYAARKKTSAGTPKEQYGSSGGLGLRLGWQENVTIDLDGTNGLSGDIKDNWNAHFSMTVRY